LKIKINDNPQEACEGHAALEQNSRDQTNQPPPPLKNGNTPLLEQVKMNEV
jgi:hypothetical protein